MTHFLIRLAYGKLNQARTVPCSIPVEDTCLHRVVEMLSISRSISDGHCHDLTNGEIERKSRTIISMARG